MKVFKRKTFATLMMSSILLLQSLSPLLAVATTVETDTTEATTSSEQSSETSAPATEQITEETPTEPVYTEVEKNYEDNELSSEYQESSAQLAVQFTKKELTKEVTFEGEILSGIEQQEGQRTETRLTKFLLQKKEKDTWEDVQSFVSKKEEEQSIQDQAYTFAYSETLKKGGVYQYRFVVDYDIQRYEEEQLKEVDQHKAHYSVGEVKVEEETTKSSEKRTQTTTSSEIGPQKEKPAKKQKSAASIQPFSGIGPQAAGDDVEHKDNGTNSWVKISSVEKDKAKFSFNYASGYTFDSTYEEFLVVWNTSASYVTNVIGAHTSGTPGKSNLPIGIYNQFLSEGNASALQVAGDGGSRIWTTPTGYGNMTGLIPSKKYYVWIFSKTYFPGNGVIPAQWSCRWHTAPVGPTGQVMEQFDFETANPVPLKVKDKPTFHSPTTTTIKMKEGRYEGDIAPTNNPDDQGYLQVNDLVNPIRDVPGIRHDLTTGGYYHGLTVTELKPGTRYYGNVVLKNYVGDNVASDWNTTVPFYTVNTVEPPDAVPQTSLNTNQSTGKATATISASYGATAGGNGAHPSQSWSDVQIFLSKTSATAADFQPLPSNQIEGTLSGNPSVNTTDRKVTFTIANLLPRQNYWVIYRVKNPSGVWSDFSVARGFTTKAVPLTVKPPMFGTLDGAPGSVRLTSSTYIGDASSNGDDGILQMSGHNTPNFSTKLTNVQYSGGKVNHIEANGRIISGLQPGTIYKARLQIRDYGLDGTNGTTLQTSGEGTVATTNEANPPTLVANVAPTASTKASLAFDATYKYNSEPGLAALPSGVLVKIKTNEQAQFPAEALPTTPHPTNPYVQITWGPRGELSFTIENLESKTQYRVIYNLKNGGGYSNWAEYSGGITTKGLALSVNPPIFDNTASTPESVKLITSTYTGDASVNGSNGVLEMGGNNTPTLSTKLTDLTYGSGKVNDDPSGRVISGLKPGTKYQARLKINDYGTDGTNGTAQPSGTTTVITPNFAHDFTLAANGNIRPTSSTAKASASFNAVYEYNSNSELEAPATAARVLIKTDDQGSFPWDSPLSTTAHAQNPYLVIDSFGGGNFNFTIENLEPNTHYRVVYCVENQGGYSNWGECKIGGVAGITTLGQEISIAAKPTVTVNNATSATLNTGNYSGAANRTDLKVQKQTGTSSWADVNSPTYNEVLMNSLQYAISGGHAFGGLTAGSRYRSKIMMRYDDSSGQWKDSSEAHGWYEYSTPNTVSLPTVTNLPNIDGTPTGAAVSVTGEYQADSQYPQHPKNSGVSDGIGGKGVQIEIKGPSDAVFVPAGSKVSDLQIHSGSATPSVSFKLNNLNTATTYAVRYRVKNDSDLWSDWGTLPSFTTLDRPDGLYINERPAEFDFGTVGFSSNNSTHPLEDTSGNETAVDFENINVNNNWSLSAKLSELKVDGESHLKLVGSSITLNNQLKETTDGGTTWIPADPTKLASGVNTTGQITLLADDSTSVELFKTADIPYGQSRFRNIIPLSSVSLFIPGNQGVKGKEYEGHITWTLNATA